MTIDSKIESFLGKEHTRRIKVFGTSQDVQKDLRILRKEAEYLATITLPLEYLPFGIHVGTSMYNFIVEPLKNSRAHSDCSEPFEINFNYYANQNGIVFSYFDGGDYFKNQEVKKTWENRTNQDKHPTNIHGIGCGMGRALLFDCADLIHIDIETATLYTGLKTSNEMFFEK